MPPDLRFTSFSKSNLRQPNPARNHKAGFLEVGADGAGLSCPGSSVVAESHNEREFGSDGQSDIAVLDLL